MALDDLEWGGADLPSGRQARLDAAMAGAERRHYGDARPPREADPADARLALVRMTEFRVVFPDWDEP